MYPTIWKASGHTEANDPNDNRDSKEDIDDAN